MAAWASFNPLAQEFVSFAVAGELSFFQQTLLQTAIAPFAHGEAASGKMIFR
jgi:hypothetical protein